jgi:plastocyanin
MGTELADTTPNRSSNLRARWTRLAVLGLVMIALAPLLMLGSGFAYGLDVSEPLPFFGSVIVVSLVAAVLVWSFGTWAKFVAILAALFGAFSMFWTAFGLEHYQSFFDFVPGVLLLPGAVIAIAASIASMVAARRGNTSEKATGGERVWLRAVAGVVILAGVVSAALTVTGRQVDAGEADATVLAKEFEFHPDELRLAGGSTILVNNEDPFFHTFTIDELDLSVELNTGSQILVEIPRRPGTYRFYCIPHAGSEPSEDSDQEEMAGTLTID